jgi:hypothetical protein
MDDQSCFYIDRLVDFGLGMGVANQMVGIMNQYMRTMDIPGSIQQLQRTVSPIYYVAIDRQPIGPLNDGEMASLIAQKKVTKDTLAWMPGMMGWQPIEQVPAILKIVALAPPPLPNP